MSNSESFYKEEIDPVLRFGDVLTGYVAITPKIRQPNHPASIPILDWDINVSYPEFLVVLSPCCSIEDNLICLAPLIKVQNTFLKNPYYKEDLTRVNRKNEPQNAFIPSKWDEKSPLEQQQLRSKGLSYALLNYFVYDQHPLLPIYTVTIRGETLEIRYYMVDFRMMYNLKCKKIIKPDNAPIETKCLQLSIQTREELRLKIAHYFGRPAEEDRSYD
jgi:hypothetical protein